MDKSLRILLADINDKLRGPLTEAMRADGGMELLAVATTGKETLRLCEELEPDVLLLELVLPELDGLAVLRTIKAWERKPLVLILTGFATPLAMTMTMEDGAAYFLSKPCPSKLIVERIRRFASFIPEKREKIVEIRPKEQPNYDSEIAELLRELGISAQLKGYRYLQEAILQTVLEGGKLQMVTKCVYPEVARHCATTASRVERAIRHAVAVSWSRGDPELLRLCFGNSVTPNSKPTNSQFIAALSEHLLLERKEASL